MHREHTGDGDRHALPATRSGRSSAAMVCLHAAALVACMIVMIFGRAQGQAGVCRNIHSDGSSCGGSDTTSRGVNPARNSNTSPSNDCNTVAAQIRADYNQAMQDYHNAKAPANGSETEGEAQDQVWDDEVHPAMQAWVDLRARCPDIGSLGDDSGAGPPSQATNSSAGGAGGSNAGGGGEGAGGGGGSPSAPAGPGTPSGPKKTAGLMYAVLLTTQVAGAGAKRPVPVTSGAAELIVQDQRANTSLDASWQRADHPAPAADYGQVAQVQVAVAPVPAGAPDAIRSEWAAVEARAHESAAVDAYASIYERYLGATAAKDKGAAVRQATAMRALADSTLTVARSGATLQADADRALATSLVAQPPTAAAAPLENGTLTPEWRTALAGAGARPDEIDAVQTAFRAITPDDVNGAVAGLTAGGESARGPEPWDVERILAARETAHAVLASAKSMPGTGSAASSTISHIGTTILQQVPHPHFP
jgi:hypothetical protein